MADVIEIATGETVVIGAPNGQSVVERVEIEVVRVAEPETAVIERHGGGDTVFVEQLVVEIAETAEQGPPGPPGNDNYDRDLVLVYLTAKL